MLDSLQNISSQNVNTNLTNINDLLAEAVTVRVEKDQLKNVTVQALAFADDMNKILDEYTTALKGDNVSTVMNTNMNMSMDMSKNNMSSMNMEASGVKQELIKNIGAYQRARALTEIATDRFNTELKGKSNVTSVMDQVLNGLDQTQSVNTKQGFFTYCNGHSTWPDTTKLASSF